ncbi:beta-ketoacyl-ACP synthase [Cyanobacterium aponinum AL20118]|uniref:Beta-ketoacyl-ACP synthase n=1 Tax=Cyanobacterium aponinum AL20115 TaxID=3090662 RepID=A0AAF0ZD54_9CHRO|nr:beta-ketoacyl-ACP synthase [Cyanobacterium aponinum]WPF90186.1 beta-ketoacyl-ACP synthase [Cyanobacterium aponinum AL20115]
MKVVVTGVSLFTCLGNTQDTWQKILNDVSGIKIQQPFSFLPPLPLGMIEKQPVSIHDLTKILIQQLCQDAKLTLPQDNIGVIVGSSRGCQSQWEHFLSSFAPDFSSLPWLHTLPSQPALMIAQYLQTQGFVSAPANACATGIVAIALGYELIKQNRCSQVVVGGVETAITPLTITGFNQMKALSQEGCFPFAVNRSGLVLGEGGGLLLLETEESARLRNAKIYGEILGWSMNCDALAMTTPESDGETAIRCVKDCLYNSGLCPQEIDYIHAHGTGTILNDQREALIIKKLFPHSPYVSSTKGFTGHTLGAGGAIASALNFLALEKQTLLPNTMNLTLDFGLNFVKKSHHHPLKKVLCFSFGFGGQNVAIAMQNIT